MKSQILINCGKNWFEFSKSKTGQLDYVGKVDFLEPPNLKDYNKYSSSAYFSPSWYIFLSENLNFSPALYALKDIDISDADIFSYLTHIGAVINAIEAKDSLLAGELYLRRQYVFDKFAPLTQYIIKDFSVEILFSLCLINVSICFVLLSTYYKEATKQIEVQQNTIASLERLLLPRHTSS